MTVRSDSHQENFVFRGRCPVHAGDGLNFEVKTEGYALPIRWRCFSHQCEKTYKPSLLGLVRGVMSFESVKTVEMKAAVKYLHDFLKGRPSGKVALHPQASRTPSKPSLPKLTREQVRARLAFPSTYFLKRGFSIEILNAMDIGYCSDRFKSFFGRHLVPVYDEEGKFCVGVLGRLPYERCPIPECGLHHRPDTPCPSRDRRDAFSKWRNSAGFAKSSHLYNYASAKRTDSPFVLLVEGPCDVWSALESDVPAVAVMGTDLSRIQAEKLARLGKLVLLAFDNAEAGQNGMRAAADHLSQTGVKWEPLHVPAEYHDVGEMFPSEVAAWVETAGFAVPGVSIW